jgi:DNA-binding NarL/FixJ family response regulator
MRFLIVDDHPITRIGVRQLIRSRWPSADVEEAPRASDAVARLAERFDAVILDLNLPDVDGLEGLVRVRRAASGAPVLVLSAHAEKAYAARALQEGAMGYLNKDRAPDELVAALERILSGERYITASLAGEMEEQLLSGSAAPPRARALHEGLSPQEYRVMLQLVEGIAVGEIAAGMHLSPKTVSTYRTRILEKLGLHGNVDLVKYCIAHGLVAHN